MKLCCFDGGRIGLIAGERIIDVSDIAGATPGEWPPVGMVRMIGRIDGLRGALDKAADRTGMALDSVRLECPIEWPNKVIAFPANYHAHIDEMVAANALISAKPANGQGFFLKANSSLSGPADPVYLPAIDGREVHHECEMAIIIGRGGRDIAVDRAMGHVFGYACLIDFVVRGKEERVMRKSFDGFCPLGPYIVTADEIAAHDDIDLQLMVNGELRQLANTRDLIVDIPHMIAMASSVMTLHPGDVIATGTPAGVAPVKGGDRVDISIAGVGAMSLAIVQGDKGSHPVWTHDRFIPA
ncbi:fumarylacetoacetate hydrolase family protein [Sphingobium sp.]|uniref:fumarylacetoacetate hydrolase family protein n=1 Tax=Sphingobium sp. TaxID=1912891 RepID=UPI003B3B5EB3